MSLDVVIAVQDYLGNGEAHSSAPKGNEKEVSHVPQGAPRIGDSMSPWHRFGWRSISFEIIVHPQGLSRRSVAGGGACASWRPGNGAGARPHGCVPFSRISESWPWPGR